MTIENCKGSSLLVLNLQCIYGKQAKENAPTKSAPDCLQTATTAAMSPSFTTIRRSILNTSSTGTNDDSDHPRAAVTLTNAVATHIAQMYLLLKAVHAAHKCREKASAQD